MAITISEKKIEDKDQNLLDTLNMVYPVGSIYMSVNSTSPASLFGGTWERIKDRFLLASGDTYSAGSTGGEAQHTLTVDEMPKHAHNQTMQVSNLGLASVIQKGTDGQGTTNGVSHVYQQDWIKNGIPVGTYSIGLGKPHNNMPPYLVVYMWKRVS